MTGRAGPSRFLGISATLEHIKLAPPRTSNGLWHNAEKELGYTCIDYPLRFSDKIDKVKSVPYQLNGKSLDASVPKKPLSQVSVTWCRYIRKFKKIASLYLFFTL